MREGTEARKMGDQDLGLSHKVAYLMILVLIQMSASVLFPKSLIWLSALSHWEWVPYAPIWNYALSTLAQKG
jgi:hypothetical protein